MKEDEHKIEKEILKESERQIAEKYYHAHFNPYPWILGINSDANIWKINATKSIRVLEIFSKKFERKKIIKYFLKIF